LRKWPHGCLPIPPSETLLEGLVPWERNILPEQIYNMYIVCGRTL
jgi:hypothetical protein